MHGLLGVVMAVRREFAGEAVVVRSLRRLRCIEATRGARRGQSCPPILPSIEDGPKSQMQSCIYSWALAGRRGRGTQERAERPTGVSPS